MRPHTVALSFGVAFGFVISWAQVTDPMVIRRMLRLQEFDVVFLMGSAIAVAALGLALLKRANATTLVTREPIGWTVARPARRHVVGSVMFGVGWALAGTCPGPMAAMIGQGRLGGLFVAAGVLLEIALQGVAIRSRAVRVEALHDPSATCI